MSSDQLFIIGNGFDLWHHLPTSYREFYKQNCNYLNQIEHYFDESLQSEELWSDFETVLGQFDESILIQENDFMDFSGDSFPTQQLYGLEDAVYNFSHEVVDDITKHFTQWIKNIVIENAVKQIKFPATAKFISFNYTDTLQRVYDVVEKNVLHIHGAVRQSSSLVFGHNNTIVEATADINSYYTDSINNGRIVLTALKKPVDKIIEDRLSPWLTNNENLSKITIIGHSLNEIDIEYFKHILNAFPNTFWECFSFDVEEANTHSNILKSIGISPNGESTKLY